MTVQEVPLLERLAEVPNPLNVSDWEQRDGYYVAAGRVSQDDVPGLIALAAKWGDWDWMDREADLKVDREQAELLPVTAWRTLADLKAEAAVEPLIEVLRAAGDEFDDWLSEELPSVFGKIGEAAIPAMQSVAADLHEKEFVRSTAACVLGHICQLHPGTRDQIVAHFSDMMAHAEQHDINFNTVLLVELVELRAVEAAEAIERAFAGNLIDCGMMGDWEAVRQELEVEGLGLPMPENPHDSTRDWQARLGFDRLLDRSTNEYEGHDDIGDQAEEPYYEEADSGALIREQRTGRNDPCPCGSGKKFKKCCLRS